MKRQRLEALDMLAQRGSRRRRASGADRAQDDLARAAPAPNPKTHHSRRKIRIPAYAVAPLRTHHARQAKERLALGPAWEDHDLVFPDELGRPFSSFRLYREYLKLAKVAGVPRIRFHDLRHTAATLLLHVVNVKIVSEMLGHSSVAITYDLYGHVTPDTQQQAPDAMDHLFGDSEPGRGMGRGYSVR